METTIYGGNLDKANDQLGRELYDIKSNLDIYTLIGLNAKAIKSGKLFLAFIQRQSHRDAALGLARVFERSDAHELCSVSGICQLAKHAHLENISAAHTFVSKYGIIPSEDWIQDIDRVFSAQRPCIRRHMKVIDRVRNTRLAHIQQNAPKAVLPSIAAFEELLAFAFDFHTFVSEGFFNTQPHPILDDRQIAGSLMRVLREMGVSNPVLDFKD